ncbi:glycoside hydrolase family 3 protein [Auriculariales sp. MPI-PUGE-AT-0066]|nr:glycoside hydrolase family 3 protein [Auriculariales sp. MPI-PUGE-AT-0066]
MRLFASLSSLALLAPLISCASIPSGAGRIAARASSPLDNISSPPAVGSGTVPDITAAWDAAFTKAQAAVKKMSLADKVQLTTGTGLGGGTCSGNIPAITSIGLPGLCLEDGPMAMRPSNQTTAFPAAINAAASFNRALIRARGVAMGSEFKGKGVNVAFAPSVNMMRSPRGGRGWETFGADPFLGGEAGYETVIGIQSSGVQANAKHLIGNEQEFARFSQNSIIDDRTLHEVYAYPFLKTMVAGVASLMCAENRINGDFACSSNGIQQQIVKKLYGYRGYILSDFLATKATSDALNGLDMTMPGNAAFVTVPVASALISPNGQSFFGGNLTSAVNTGTISSTFVDGMATRILAGLYLLKQDNNTAFKGPTFTKDVRTTANTKVARDLAAASVILLKNTGSALPLSKAKLAKGIAVIGSDARPPSSLPLISAYVGSLNDGSLAMGWGSGAATLTTFSSPAEALTTQSQTDGTAIVTSFDDWNVQSAAAAATGKSAALVFIKTMSGEGQIVPSVENDADGINPGDRSNISAWNNGDNLIQAVAAVNKNTIVVVHSVGAIDMEKWVDHVNVTAIVWAGVPGQESGNALVDVLYGKVNPSGRLPFTIAKKEADYPSNREAARGLPSLRCEQHHPRFAFGFGLSYTSFTYSSLSVTKGIQPLVGTPAQNWLKGLTASGDGVSTQPWLHNKLLTVTFKIKNTGSVAGTEIPQLYLTYPSSAGEPPKVLRGFESVSLAAGETKTVTMPISPIMLSIWDTAGQGWKRPSGSFTVNIGPSSRSFQLTGTTPSI